MSLDLFNLNSKTIFYKIENNNGINIDGTNSTNVRYEDDADLMACNSDAVQQMLNKLEDIR